MENVILIVHLILAVCLIGIVLLQRNEGGGLGMGGGGTITGRAPTTPLGKLTWFFAICFIASSIALTIIAAENAAGSSVVDRLGGPAPAAEQEGTAQEAPATEPGLLPPAPVVPSDTPAAPPRAD
ncbi:preprotein translocase subunit SecG [Rhodovulum sulfidophilum]|uniref:preprotein translocase subunit SecG n=1 Tax=Rhodovulum sulfidophilum TaxID=35806 RepID=UPI00192271BB|nr:preprotein translocase subunit SecG [Rhodovulum sulfidophilum]MBL3575047.1 preprotein translocase subunit SecG [Rhodovulum sulfidophilum]MBL3596542.1 preprotein translocase subunit SecG [Rhodovulum sulfidophilum]MCE8431892.1 preprotein translocase subunit SecG [Rhodovulum sulfidophilum]MCF4115956.1 preprotein translocase subunit SecG [Rhodovulum sulfidophilum]